MLERRPQNKNRQLGQEHPMIMGFCGSMVRNPPAKVEDVSSIPGSGRSPGEGNGNSLQHSCLGNPLDRGTWLVTVHGVTKESDTT